jgi:hypothetical protein
VGGGGEGGYVGAGLGDDDVGDRPADPRDAGEELPGACRELIFYSIRCSR